MSATVVTCKSCLEPFTPDRAGAQYCSGRCRTAAYRKRIAPPPMITWRDGNVEPRFRATSQLLNSDGTAALSREQLAERLIEIAYEEDGGEPKTGRRYWYLALSHGFVLPDMGSSDAAKRSRTNAQKRITALLGVLRKQGRLGWGMVLDLTRELDQWQTFRSPREARADLRQHYDEDRWLGQPFYPILIVEKDTMEPVCKPMAQRWQMPFASSRGYGSLKLQHDVAEMLIRRREQTGQLPMVYFVSDLDPSGLDLERWQEALRNFNVPVWRGDNFLRVGLTREQVADPDLDIERLAIAVKPSDSRAKHYIEEHGERCWEADVLAADVIRHAIDDHVRSWLGGELWERRDVEIERARSLL